MTPHLPSLPSERIAEFCRCHGVARLSLFGSASRTEAVPGLGTFGPDSDIDLLVEFQPGRTPGLIGLGTMEAELSELLGRKVDLRTPMELSERFRDEVVRSARLLHAA
ncbi:MAG: nucleotidyltransferase family protein [Phycisphaerales bacterium]